MAPLLKDEAYGMFVDIDGTRTELDKAACEAVRSTLKVIAGGKLAGGSDPWLTTGQAAEELGVSRRTLTRILDRGEIPYERYGTGHRRLRMSDVLRYRDAESARRKEALENLREISYKGGLDDLDMIEGYLAQFGVGE